MTPSQSNYDVLVVGAGPAGCVTAMAHAQRGAKVLLLEAEPAAAGRFAGEWLHTAGVDVLDALRLGHLESARARSGYGFVIVPDDGGAPIEMPYRRGVALTGEHRALVGALREAAQGHADIEVCVGLRAVKIDGHSVRLEAKKTGGSYEVSAGRIVGADGRRSTVRRSMGLPDQSDVISSMAAVELRDVALPTEGFGHLFLGGPGPALFYRISDDAIRGCLDVPLACGAEARTRNFLWEGFAPALPGPLRDALRDSFERDSTVWAVNRFRPRSVFGRGHVALVGDAVGHVHPMTAAGMTLGLLDGYTLAQSDSIEEYANRRRSYVPELLSNALYHCFRREDESATTLRRALLATLRSDRAERLRTMDILASADTRRRTFGTAFLRVAAQAMGTMVTETTSTGNLRRLPKTVAGLVEWMQWPAALAVPSMLDRRVRAQSSTTHPIPQFASMVPTAARVEAPEPTSRTRPRDVSVAEALESGSSALLRRLELQDTSIDSVTGDDLTFGALEAMQALLMVDMSPGTAARMTLSRRRLAKDGVPRLLATTADSANLAKLIAILFGGPTWGEAAVTELAEGVRVLLDCQRASGAFGRHPSGSDESMAHTAMATTALVGLLERRPEGTDADVEGALDRAVAWVRKRQHSDGFWGPENDLTSELCTTAQALEVLSGWGSGATDPAVRRGLGWLMERLRAFGDDQTDGGEYTEQGNVPLHAWADAVYGVVEIGNRPSEAGSAVVQHLAEQLVNAGELELGQETVAATVRALASLDVRRRERPRRKPRRVTSTQRRLDSPITESHSEDWNFCKRSLAEVSRTFARPIALLSPNLEVAVSLGYLLCRIADTIEDHANLPIEQRDDLFRRFLGVLDGVQPPTRLEEGFREIAGDNAELQLGRSASRVFRVFDTLDEATKSTTRRWIPEMARGMSLYTHRTPGTDGIAALHTVTDLERYCYYVAGTVGHFLTDLFVDAAVLDPTGAKAIALRDEAENFACGLQLTNILKDVTDDHARGVCFLPAVECHRQGFSPSELADPSVRRRAHAAVRPLFQIARQRLDGALRYALLIPPNETAIRLFCLLPLWMAARTLVLAEGNDAMFVPGVPVKIARSEVEGLIAACMRDVADDQALQEGYERLYERRVAAAAG